MNTVRKLIIPISIAGLVFFLMRIYAGTTYAGIYRQIRLFAVAFFAAALLAPFMGWVSRRVGAMDHPDPRKIHRTPTPILGGVAVFAAFFLAHFIQLQFTREMIGIFIGSCFLLVVGVVDDMTGGIPAKLRMAAQLIASVIVIYFGVVLSFAPHTLWGRVISIILTVFWLVGITNAMNFLDGMDGLASGLSTVAAGTFFVIAYRLNSPYLGFISIALCGASAGFLIHNLKPAKIFLGDGGSTFIGFALACFGVLGKWSSGNPFVSFTVPVIVLGVPIFDMIYTTIERFATGKARTFGQWLAYTGKDHFHHRLSDHGFGDIQVVSFIYFINLTLGFSAVVITISSNMINVFLMLAQTTCVFLIIAILMLFSKRNINNGNEK